MLRLRQNELAVAARGHGELRRSAECAWDDVICGKLLALVMAPEAAHRTETDRHNLSLYRVPPELKPSIKPKEIRAFPVPSSSKVAGLLLTTRAQTYPANLRITREKIDERALVATLFFSYAHADENLRDQLEKHLSALKRQGVIKSWHDRQITAGTELNGAIDANLNSADIILLLISPDFIDSDYCYDSEMKRAMERHQKGEARVIPVILRPCDWHGLVFGKLLATPTDGKPITKWTNIDEAFLEVVKAIKGTLNELGKPQNKPTAPGWARAVEETLSGTSQQSARSSNLRVKKNFTDLDRDQFIHDGFEYIAKFFENSLEELVSRNTGLEYRFKRIDANRFTAAAYQGGEKVCKGSASIGNGVMSSGGIQYSMTDEPTHGGMNESVSAEGDDQTLYFQALGMQSYGRDKEKLTMQGAAELFWDLFIRPLQE